MASLLPPGFHMLDGQMYSTPGLLSVYLVSGEKLALIDPGPTTSVPAVLSGIRGAGFAVADVDYLIATHLHLDHCGGVGELVKVMPRAQVVIQERGVRHLVDPTRLIRSVVELLGQAWLDRDGTPTPVSADRVIAVAEGSTLELGGGLRLRVVHIPGHAPSEVCYYEEKTGSLFPGDALGVWAAPRYLVPVCPAPSYDLDQALLGIERIAALGPRRLLFPHFGVTIRVKGTLNQARRRLNLFARCVAKAHKQGRPDRGLGELTRWAEAELAPLRDSSGMYDFFFRDIIPLSVAGLWDFYQRQAAML